MIKWFGAKKQELLRSVAAISFCLACMVASAHATPLIGNTGGYEIPFALFGEPGVAGFSFTSSQTVRVTRLGVFDYGYDGLADSHMVGIFDAGGTLLTSARVESGTTAPIDINGYRWENLLTPYILNADTEYVLGALYIGDGVGDVFQNIGEIEDLYAVQEGLIAFDSILTKPFITLTINNIAVSGLFGPNLDATPVPEPSTLLLLAAGLTGIVIGARRRKN